jgi:undecaprenyl diphosphate synthase
MWPEFDREKLEEAILEFQRRERRYGRTGAQVRGGDAS